VWASIYDVPFETSEVKFNNIFLSHIFRANSFVFIGSYIEIWTDQYVLSQIDRWEMRIHPMALWLCYTDRIKINLANANCIVGRVHETSVPSSK